ncbi:hypothetical protein [Massilia sp. ST3]|uniref:hypothetical protein n=1 Tax=Massilia sp. ST3 TaxID=2824903 RepID=UPI001B81227E|nr:hypothetical protein [Massilia sp. ST3]MBQ5949065.1 hypothetical protein [Massilia sp. ST3]
MTAIRPQRIGILLLSIFLFLCLGAGAADAHDPNTDIYGRWRVTKDVSPEGAITAKSERQIRAVIGKTAMISPGEFDFNGSRCKHPVYKRSIDDTKAYFLREWRLSPESLSLGKRLTIVEVECDLYLLYPAGENRLIIAIDGNFYEAARMGGKLAAGPVSTRGGKEEHRANDDIFGIWQIDGVTWGKGRLLTQKEAKMLMGMQVQISATKFSYHGNACEQPAYKRSRKDKATYFHGDWRSDPTRLPLPDELVVIATQCGTIYPLGRARILIEDKRGMFFSAIPLGEPVAGSRH